MPGDPRTTQQYQRQRAAFLRRHDLVCHWCGKAVYDSVPRGHPLKATIDHGIEVDRAPAFALDESTWVIACLGCNSSRGQRYRAARDRDRGQASREW